MQHVTFAGPAPMVTSLLGGHIQYGVTNPSAFMAHLKEGKHKLDAMAVLSAQKDSTIPDVRTLGDYGITGIESAGWLGALAPAKTPPAVIARWNAELLKALRTQEIIDKMRASYLEVTGSTPEEFGRFIVTENRKWFEGFKLAGIKPE